MKDGNAIAGLFDPSTNAMTHLTGEIDVFPKRLPKNAPATHDKIPVFLRISTQLWRYVGEYTLDEIVRTKSAKEKEGHPDAAAVLRFKPVNPPLKLIAGKSARRS